VDVKGGGTIFNPEDADSIFLRNFGIYLQVYMALQLRTQRYSIDGLIYNGFMYGADSFVPNASHSCRLLRTRTES
jgi:hypothetical protein